MGAAVFKEMPEGESSAKARRKAKRAAERAAVDQTANSSSANSSTQPVDIQLESGTVIWMEGGYVYTTGQKLNVEFGTVVDIDSAAGECSIASSTGAELDIAPGAEETRQISLSAVSFAYQFFPERVGKTEAPSFVVASAIIGDRKYDCWWRAYCDLETLAATCDKHAQLLHTFDHLPMSDDSPANTLELQAVAQQVCARELDNFADRDVLERACGCFARIQSNAQEADTNDALFGTPPGTRLAMYL